MMRNLCVIPARGGSKGVPNKNIKLLNGKPLISYTVRAAIESKIFDTVIVSTDSESIANIAKEYGAEVPFMRPSELAGDFVSSDDVILHALEYYEKRNEKYDVVCKLQPTSPLRNKEHIEEAYQLFNQKQADFVVSVCECEHSPLWSGIIGSDLCLDQFMTIETKLACRQKLPTYYRLNGAIYMAKVPKFYENKSFFGVKGIAYIMQQEESIDIDSNLDFKIAELIVTSDYI